MTNSNDALRAALERHYPEGIWAQPCGNRVLVCGCGDILWGVDSSACKAAWRLHILEATPSLAGGDLREALANTLKGNITPIIEWEMLWKDHRAKNNDEADLMETRKTNRDYALDSILAALNQPAAPVEAVEDDVRRLVIAAREAWQEAEFSFPSAEVTGELDKAVEAFSSRVPYEDEPPEPAASTVAQGEATYEARYVVGGMPTDCVDYGVISLTTGKEVCRVWERDDAERIARLLNAATHHKGSSDGQ